ncbi:MAG: M48 family metalloprotease [Pseudomonadota bacterium]
MNRFVRWSLSFFILLLTTAFPVISAPELRKGQIIRDCEIESTLRDYIDPIFRVAKLNPKSLHLYIMVNPEINASASLGPSILINTGLITKSANVGELIGVIAHETGHIADGHVVRTFGALEKAQIPMIAALVLGAAAGVMAGDSRAAAAIMMGGMETGRRSFLIYSRGQESAADQAAVKYLDALGWSSKGMMQFMQVLEQQELLSSARQDPYLLTHPLSKDRVAFFKHHVEKSVYSNEAYPFDFRQKYDRMKIKIMAFSQAPNKILEKYPASDTTLISQYARAIALFRSHRLPEAIETINRLIEDRPKDPFFYELKGQMLFESGKVTEALPIYKKAVSLAPDAGLMRILLAHVLIEQNQSRYDRQAIEQLNKAKRSEQENPLLWRMLAVAYGRTQQKDVAELMLAEQALTEGRKEHASRHAELALKKLPVVKKVERQRAQDILNEIKQESA